MTANEARTLLDYTRWANDLMLEAVGALSDEQFTRDMHSSFSSVRDTLTHLAGADWLWLERWHGRWHMGLPSDWTLLTFPDVAQRWRAVQDERAVMFANASDDDVRRRVTYKNLRGEEFTQGMDSLLRHVMNHSTYHRGQITTMLRQLGASAPSTDYVVYDRTQNKG